jgi:hypothetical protein
VRRRDFLQLGALPVLARGEKQGASCIFLKLTGGPSHIDTWDMKPDAPSEIRGPFRPIRTNVPGIEISEIFPRMAKHADKYALIRSVYSDVPAAHDVGNAVRPIRAFSGECRRAVERVDSGTRFVCVNMFDTVFDELTWDIHGWKPFSPISSYRDVVGPMFDMAYSSLLEDLSRRGLLETTLVVAMGEFGRTPRINPSGGRDHWPGCWTVLLAGGGVRGGRIYGSSDKIGAEPRDNPVTAAMLTATVRYAMGIAPEDGARPIEALFS